MYSYGDVQELHLELTSHCNAGCPQCPRNLAGGAVNPHLPLTELTLDDIRKILPDELLRRMSLIFMCGNYGDASVARDTIAVFEHFRSVNSSLRLGIHTNGSARTPEWWRRLAAVVDYCRFGIDGLEDTNHIYRRGTRWSSIMANVAAFIGAEGTAEWDFLVFRHNEHQIDEAAALARTLGFTKFFVKQTERFLTPGEIHESAKKEVRNRDRSLAYTIAPPSDAFRNRKTAAFTDGMANRGDYDSYIAATPIHCKVIPTKRIYISAEGLVFPCCYTANIYRPHLSPMSGEIWDQIRRLPNGKRSLDGRLTPIGEIIDGPFFQQLIPEGWREGLSEDGRLQVCARTCGNRPVAADSYRLI
jgi:MoaA/NifB/PqqE/SkfB family radical SAM enzyme